MLVLQNLRESELMRDSIVVLTGSFAHGSQTSRSDIDVLVLRRGAVKRIRSPYGVHLHFADLDDFRRRLAEGDDFAFDAISFGDLLHDGLGFWESLREEVKTAKWPDWRTKIGQAHRRIGLADELLALGDLDAAAEEYLLAATQLGRASLLRRGIYPRSRPELSDQLRAVGETGLAEGIDRLYEQEYEKRFLRRIGRDLKETMQEQV